MVVNQGQPAAVTERSEPLRRNVIVSNSRNEERAEPTAAASGEPRGGRCG